MAKFYNIHFKSLHNPLNTLIFQQKHLKHTIALHFPKLLPKKTAKYGPQIEFMTKNIMISLKVYTTAGCNAFDIFQICNGLLRLVFARDRLVSMNLA